MRISDWSSDVCSSDLVPGELQLLQPGAGVSGPDPEVLLALQGRGGRAGRRGPQGRRVARVHGVVGPGPVQPRHRQGRGADRGAQGGVRTEERRGGQEWGRTWRSRWWPDEKKKK